MRRRFGARLLSLCFSLLFLPIIHHRPNTFAFRISVTRPNRKYIILFYVFVSLSLVDEPRNVISTGFRLIWPIHFTWIEGPRDEKSVAHFWFIGNLQITIYSPRERLMICNYFVGGKAAHCSKLVSSYYFAWTASKRQTQSPCALRAT